MLVSWPRMSPSFPRDSRLVHDGWLSETVSETVVQDGWASKHTHARPSVLPWETAGIQDDLTGKREQNGHS